MATPPSEQFADILTDAYASRINFALTTLQINGNGFREVAKALQSGNIKVVESNVDDADAEYDPYGNRFLIGAYDPSEYRTISGRALLVHEAVHAIIDIKKLA